MNFYYFSQFLHRNFFRKNSGFTLLELLITLGILTIIGSIGLVSLQGFRSRQALGVTTVEVVNILRRAQQAARSQESGTSWGVYFENPQEGLDTFALFQGTSYATGTPVYSRKLTRGISYSQPGASSTMEIVFSQVTGLPNTSATIKIALNNNANASSTIVINTKGEISY